jgi:hypothetical protein
VNATNSPLDQWQIDHIRKMKQELGMPQSAPNAEEVTMDGEDTETDMPTGGLDYAQAQQDYDLASQKVRDQIQSHIDVLEGARGKLRDRRVGPSDSEKWLAIAAALGQPTRTGAFGESLGNLAQTLGAQKSARREAEEKRDLMLEKYGLDVGTERLRLLQTGATQAGQTLRAAMAAKNKDPYAGAVYDPDTKSWVFRPGSAAAPPVLSLEEVARLAQDPANRGMKFYTKDGVLREIE